MVKLSLELNKKKCLCLITGVRYSSWRVILITIWELKNYSHIISGIEPLHHTLHDTTYITWLLWVCLYIVLRYINEVHSNAPIGHIHYELGLRFGHGHRKRN